MRRANIIEKESRQIETVKDLTSVFESLASTQVAKVKSKTELSQRFFNLLWQRYSSIRIDPKKRITNRVDGGNNRKVLVLISAEAGLSGDLDQRMIETMEQAYDRGSTDIIVLGSHGASQLRQKGIPFIKFFQLPESDRYIDVSPIIDIVLPYDSIVVYYEEYISLGVQEVKSIDLISHMKTMTIGEDVVDVITDKETIFEPSLDEIADQMEMMMMTLALAQTILQSSLAQAASRFNAMAVAEKRAGELLDDYKLEFHRAKRSESDRRMREVMVSIKKKKRREGARA